MLTRLADARSTSVAGSNCSCAVITGVGFRREGDGQRRERRLLLEVGLLARELLDLAADGRQLGLDGEDVLDRGGLGHDGLQGRLGRLQVLDAGREVDDIAGDVVARWICSSTTFWARPRRPTSASSQLAAGIRKVTLA